jgi:hypothetical protein
MRSDTLHIAQRAWRRDGAEVVAILLALTSTWGCSDGSGAHLPAFSDIQSAPSPIQAAAKAVVRIHTAGSYGTGAFISASGLLLTNNHVLGAGVCPVEGCHAQLAFMHQRGEFHRQSMTVLAVPVAVDVGLDMATVQIFVSPGAVLSTPDFLTISDLDATSLLGRHVTVVGHPGGGLKKWTDGIVADAFGDWFATTAYTLPGSSGSPALDDEGHLLGIIHRGSTGEDLITSDSVNVSSTGTASAPLLIAMQQASLPSVMRSLGAPTTADDVVAHDVVYLNGSSPTVALGGTTADVLGLLGRACDLALGRTDLLSPDDLTEALAPCSQATLWIECRADASPVPYGVVCPGADEASSWANRFQAMNRLWVALNGNTDLYPITFATAALASSLDAGRADGASRLSLALTSAGQVLDFGVAYYLAAFDVESYANVRTLDYLRSYTRSPHHELFARSIASAFLWLNHYGRIGQDEALTVLDRLMRSPNVGVGAKLAVEESQYALGH